MPIKARMIAVISGKGGVGKSSVAVQLALRLALAGKKVGLLDVDLCGPSVPRMLDVANSRVTQGERGWRPITVADGEGNSLKAMSIAFLLPRPDDAVVWRGPKKTTMIKQFIYNVDWGELDYLVIDTPPGTSDEHIAIAEILSPASTSAIIVTTPQLVALADVEREIGFCQQLGVPILGVIENMSGYRCPHCAHCTKLFSSEGGRLLAEKHELAFLAKLPICPALSKLWESEGAQPLKNYPLKAPELFDTFGQIISQLDLV